MPHSQVNQGVDGGPPDQDPVMGQPMRKMEDGWSQAIKQS